ncbi:hypothetical protein ACFQ0K_03550 [Nocardioides caeni]|uniref:Uncharacterized protein n=1 Tax=Nocardioides caeni TaxID=574700 RepID=A0A4S8NRS3_9ACTN|nr:hypothetical protein [Nocardioides caeni]THV18129.1 hypothetical protein E9934_00250 [Nocardioides caeni]
MKLHESLAELAHDHGHGLFRDAAAFRGSLDDYLDEGQASSGTINLLTDAVRLGALDGMLSMLDSGANPADAVDSAGQRLARDRGSADVRGCQWALAVLGFALGRVPEGLVTGLDPDASTASPPQPTMPSSYPPAPPVQSPVPPPLPPVVSPAHQPVAPSTHVASPPVGNGYGAAPHGAGWSQPTPPGATPKRTGLIVGIVVAALVLIVGGIVAIIALTSGDDSDGRTDDRSSSSASPSESSATESPTEIETSSGPVEVPDLGGETFDGVGYRVGFPEGWQDGTEEFKSTNPNVTTLDKVFIWGRTFNSARGNIIVEIQSSYGNTDPDELKDTWKQALVLGDSTATITDGPDTEIDGQRALTVDISRTNDGGVTVTQRSVLVISGPTGYSITVSLKEGDEGVLDEFEKVLGAWRWTD